MRRLIGCGVIALTVAGCHGLPTPDYLGDKAQDKPSLSIKALTQHIRCELERDSDTLTKLSGKHYVAAVTLQLKVEDTGGATPNLAFLDAGTNFTHLIDLNYNVDRQQIFNTSYTLDTEKLADESNGKRPGHANNACFGDPPADYRFTLSGELGLAKVINSGLDIDGDADLNTGDPPTPGSGVSLLDSFSHPTEQAPNPKPAEKSGDDKKNGGTPPTFGTTVQFTILHSYDAGPNWILKGFTGPSGTSKGMFNYANTTTDNLVISFSPAKTNSADDKANATAKALSFTTNSILQNLRNSLK